MHKQMWTPLRGTATLWTACIMQELGTFSLEMSSARLRFILGTCLRL
jgi:hypothetical protein